MNTRTNYITFYAILGFILIANLASFLIESTPDYYSYANALDLAEIIDTRQLTTEALENRNGKLIIEKCIGVVTDASTGAGYVIDNKDFYISYSCVDDISNGDVICTYFVYNPDTNYIDDILERFDYVIDDK